MKDGSDKRRSSRKHADYVVELYDTTGSFLEGVGRLLDLSPTGALVESTLRLMPGQALLARIRRGEQASLELPVTVIRVQGKGASLTYGLHFKRP
jgi:hypothetical protein